MTLAYQRELDGSFDGHCSRVWITGAATDDPGTGLLRCPMRAERKCNGMALCAEHSAEWLAHARRPDMVIALEIMLSDDASYPHTASAWSPDADT